MQNRSMQIIHLAIIFCLTSCGSSNSDDRSAGDSKQNSNKLQTPTLLDAQIDSIHKAENVEDMLQKANQARKQNNEEL